jgi:hypothetical protein
MQTSIHPGNRRRHAGTKPSIFSSLLFHQSERAHPSCHSQYFKNAQFPHLAAGLHPLDRPGYSALYVYLNAVLSFFMLVASNGLVELYNMIRYGGVRHRSAL